MKKSILAALFALICLPAVAQVQFFEGSWDELLAKAKAEKKLVMVDFWAPWCGPCRMMNAQTFKNEEVGALVNQHFISYKINTDEPAARAIYNQYQQGGIPLFVFLNPQGKMVHSIMGFHDVNRFKPVIDMVLKKAGVDASQKSSLDKNPSGEARATYPEQKEAQMEAATQALTGQDMYALLQEAYNLGRSHNEFELDAVKKK